MSLIVKVVDRDGFGAQDISRIESTLQSIADKFLDWDTRDHGLALIYPRNNSPFTTTFPHGSLEVHAIGLSARNTLEPYVYEFGHELGHVICSGPHPGHWVYNGICEGIALVMLKIAGNLGLPVRDDFSTYLNTELDCIRKLVLTDAKSFLTPQLSSLETIDYVLAASRNAQRAIAIEFLSAYDQIQSGITCLKDLTRSYPGPTKNFFSNWKSATNGDANTFVTFLESRLLD